LLERQRKRHKMFKRSLQKPLLQQLSRPNNTQRKRYVRHRGGKSSRNGSYKPGRNTSFDPLKKQNLMKELEFNHGKQKMISDLETGLKKLKQSTPTNKDRAKKNIF
jgi:hypothetical protein